MADEAMTQVGRLASGIAYAMARTPVPAPTETARDYADRTGGSCGRRQRLNPSPTWRGLRYLGWIEGKAAVLALLEEAPRG